MGRRGGAGGSAPATPRAPRRRSRLAAPPPPNPIPWLPHPPQLEDQAGGEERARIIAESQTTNILLKKVVELTGSVQTKDEQLHKLSAMMCITLQSFSEFLQGAPEVRAAPPCIRPALPPHPRVLATTAPCRYAPSAPSPAPSPTPGLPHPHSAPLQSATSLPGIQKVLALKGPLEAMMGELSANLPPLITQGGSPHQQHQQQPAVTIQELPDGAAAAALALPAPPQGAASPPHQQFAQLYLQQQAQLAEAAAPGLPKQAPLMSPHTPHDARLAAALGGAPGSGRLAPGTPATAPGSGGLKGSLDGAALAEQLPAFAAASPGLAAAAAGARSHALLDLTDSELSAAQSVSASLASVSTDQRL
jgi:hypothetical protein